MQQKITGMNAIESRKSIRNYEETPISTDDLEQIQAYLDDPENLIGPYGTNFTFEILLEPLAAKKEQIGTYGFVKNAQGYMIGICKNHPVAAFEYGYVFEGLVLYLTSLGIGTCWLAGTFDRQALLSSLSLSDDEIIPAISPIGYPKDKPHLKERIQRRVLKARARKPKGELFHYGIFGDSLDGQADIYQKALRYVHISPSGKNRQPWRLLISKDLSIVHFYIASALVKEKAFAIETEYLDVGIAYRHFIAGMDEEGATGKLLIEDPKIQMPAAHHYITTWYRD